MKTRWNRLLAIVIAVAMAITPASSVLGAESEAVETEISMENVVETEEFSIHEEESSTEKLSESEDNEDKVEDEIISETKTIEEASTDVESQTQNILENGTNDASDSNKVKIEEEVASTEIVSNEISSNEIPIIDHIVEDPGKVSLKSGNYQEWIDRIDIPDYGIKLYNSLVEATDNNGSNDWLIDINQGETLDNGLVGVPLFGIQGEGKTLEEAQDNYRNKKSEVNSVLQAVFDAFRKDYPNVFWLSENILVYSSPTFAENDNGYEYSTLLYFVLKSNEYDIRDDDYRNTVLIKNAISEINSIADSIVRAASGNDASKVKYFNSWLTKNCGYNTLFFNGGTAPRSAAYCVSALLGKSGEEGPICEGYATAFKVLCDKANIPCTIFTGDVPVQGGTKPHAWNYVQIWGKWYAVDVTWNDPLVGGVEDTDGITSYLLVGSDTIINAVSFADSHPFTNKGSPNGISFVNAPELNSQRLINFVPEEDGWRFKNYANNSVNLTETDEIIFRYWTMDASVNMKKWLEEHIHPSIDWKALFFSKDDELKNKEWEKVGLFLNNELAGANCFGMSITALLVKYGYMDLKEIDENATVLHDVSRSDNVESIIGVHQIIQQLPMVEKMKKEFMKKPITLQIREILSGELPYLLRFGHDPSWWHAVVVYEIENGSFTWNGHPYDVVLKTYDPNCPPGSSVDNEYYVYINTSTNEWEIPAYYSENICSYGGGIFRGVISNIEALKSNSVTQLRESYNQWIRSYDSYELLLETKNGKYVINGEFESEDGLVSAYFDTGDVGCPILNIRFNTSEDYTIKPISETDKLNIKVLTENAYIGAIAENYDSVTIENSGNINLFGMDGIYGISIATDDLPTSKNHFVIGGQSYSDICIKQTDDGIEVTNDNLKNGMGILLYDDNNQDEAEVSIDVNKILITEKNNVLTGYVDKDGDGTFEEEVRDMGLVTKIVASGSCGDSAQWTLDDKGKLTISGSGDTYSWGDGSGAPWKDYREKITEVVVEEGITSIGTFGFIRCKNLKQVSLPTSLKKMGTSAFSDCTSLESIQLNEGFERLAGATFYKCTNLQKVILPSTLKYISYSEFYGCEKLKTAGPIGGDYDIQYAWSDSIPEKALMGSDIESFAIKESIQSIGDSAFAGCQNLGSIEFPDNIKIIGEHAFYNCKSLVSIVFPSTCVEINSNAFGGCSSLTEMYFTFNPPTISEDAFSDDTITAYFPSGNPYWTAEVKINYGGNITWKEWQSPVTQVVDISDATITLGDAIVSLDKEKYRYTGEEIKPSFSVAVKEKILERDRDYKVSYKNNINVGQASIIVEGIGNYTGIVEKSFYIANYCGDNIEWEIDANGLLTLSGEGDMDDFAIGNNPGWINLVKSIVFDSRITRIGAFAFWCNYDLQEITLPDALTSIGNYAFYQDSGLKKVSFGNSLSNIGSYAFRNCSAIERFDMPESVTDIGAGFVNGCSNLKEIYFYGNAPKFAQEAFSGFSGTVYYPSTNTTWTTEKRLQYGGKVTWKTLDGSDVPSEKPLEDCLFELEETVFNYNGNPKEPDVRVYDKGEYLREGTDFTVTYENNIEPGEGNVIVTGTGKYVGTVCLNIRILKIGSIIQSGSCGDTVEWDLDDNGVLYISGSGTMSNWTEESPRPWNDYADSIKVVIIDHGVTSIGDYAFCDCQKINAVSIGQSVKTIGEFAFAYIADLTNICIPDCVETIKTSAFSGSWLEKVSLGKGLQRIEDYAFEGNFALTSVVFPESIIYLGSHVFDGRSFKEIYFCGDAPEMGFLTFLNEDDATVYYPEWSDTWDEDTRNSQVWGNITWKSWNPGNKKSISSSVIKLDTSEFVYNGDSIEPSISVYDEEILLKENVDYRVAYTNNTNAGTATVVVTGIGDYTGTIEKNFTILKADQTLTVSVDSESIEVGETATITANGTGTITYSSSDTKVAVVDTKGIVTGKAAGTATLTVKAAGDKNYKQASKTIRITVKEPAVHVIDISTCEITVADVVYTGEPLTPAVTIKKDGVTLQKDTDYTVSYKNNTNAGTATVMVTGTGNYTGSVEKTFTILKADQTLEVSVSSSSIAVGGTAAITASGTGAITYSSSNTKVAAVDEQGIITGIAAGTATITVKAAGDGNYKEASKTLSISVILLQTPVLSKVESVYGGVRVTWAAVTGAENYRVYRKTGSGSWTRIGDTTEPVYLDTTAKSGTRYVYTVRCLNKDATAFTSSFDRTGKAIIFIGSPVLGKAENVNGGVKVSWSKVTGAVKYRVFRKTAGTGWKKLADTTALTYTDKTAVSGTEYTYTVRCINKVGTGYTSGFDANGLTITYVQTPVLSKVESVYGGVRVTWAAVPGAENYRVYRKTGSGSWTKIGDTTEPVYLDTTAKSSVRYVYTVRCLNKDATAFTSSFDRTGKAIIFIASPVLGKAENVNGGVKISWSKVTGAVRYRVFCRSAGTGWKKIADTTALTYTDTTAVSGTEYTYTVRCINKAGTGYTSGFDANGLTITYLQTPVLLRVENIYGGVKVTWAEVPGAENYRVYRKTGSGSWTRIGDTTKTVYTDAAVVSGTKYTYTVRCLNKDATAFTSSFNRTGKGVTYIAAPALNDPKIVSGGIQLSWGKVPGAVKYRVFRKTADSNWIRLANTTALTYTDKTAVSGVEYRYTVRCISSDGKVYTSNYDVLGKTVVAGSAYARDQYAKVIFDDSYGQQRIFCYHIPEIILLDGTKAAANEQIRQDMMAILEEGVFPYEGESEPMIASMLYQWGISGDTLSVVIQTSMQYYWFDYYVYNISLTTGQLVDSKAMLAQNGYTEDSFYEAAGGVMTRYMDEYVKGFGMGEEDFNEIRTKTLTESNIKSSIPFIKPDGSIGFVANIYSAAGADHYYHLMNLEGEMESDRLKCGIDHTEGY